MLHSFSQWQPVSGKCALDAIRIGQPQPPTEAAQRQGLTTGVREVTLLQYRSPSLWEKPKHARTELFFSSQRQMHVLQYKWSHGVTLFVGSAWGVSGVRRVRGNENEASETLSQQARVYRALH